MVSGKKHSNSSYKRGEGQNREEGEVAQKKVGRREKQGKKVGRRRIELDGPG